MGDGKSGRFYRTYKELKLYSNSRFIMHMFRFYRTYKELKPLKYSSIFSTTSRFYRTYKELKPRTVNTLPLTGAMVFIVPIRNWNKMSKEKVTLSPDRFYRTYKELKRKYYGRNWELLF